MDLPVLQREERPALGDFYVESECCLCCGVPQAAAPDLVGWVDDQQSRCYWIKQPQTPEELERAYAVLDGQEAGCHRYAGHDPAIQARVGRENCDFPVDTSANLTPSDATINLWTAPTLFERIWTKLRRHE